jgi:hypothetical protein
MDKSNLTKIAVSIALLLIAAIVIFLQTRPADYAVSGETPPKGASASSATSASGGAMAPGTSTGPVKQQGTAQAQVQ